MQSFLAWLKQPFDTNMSAFRWFLFFGLVVIIMTSWGLILSNIEDAVS